MMKEDSQSDGPKKRPKRPWWFRTGRFLVIAYVVILCLMVLLEERLLFPGAYLNLRGPVPIESVRDFEYLSLDGSPIKGRLLARQDAERTVLFLHGNGVRVEALDPWVTRLSEALSANVLAAEYRGFQSSSGITPTEANVVSDGLAAHDALAAHFDLPSEEIIVYGRSLGGGCAAAIASRRDTSCLILDRTFDSAINVAAEKYWMFPIRLLMKNEFDSVHRLNDFDGRVFQLHGDIDGVVPIQHGRKLHEAIRTPDKHFLELPGLGHNDSLDDRVLAAIRDFVNGNGEHGETR